MMRKLLLFLIGILAAASAVAQQPPADRLLDAMRDEMKRSKEQLRLPDLERPYYLDYSVVDADHYAAGASLGALISSGFSHSRILHVNLRVGDYKFDNTNFISTTPTSRLFVSPVLAVDDDYSTLRRAIWLSTDAAYKMATEALARKRGYVKNINQSENVDDYTPATPIKVYEGRAPAVSVNRGEWEERLRRLSLVLRQFPAIAGSRVEWRVASGTIYFVSSEGAEIVRREQFAALGCAAATQASDGMVVKNAATHYARTADGLPSEQAFGGELKRMAEKLVAAAQAPVLDDYSGPVLLEGQAAAALFAQLVGRNATGFRRPLVDNPRAEAMLPVSELEGKLGSRILPDFFTVFDDPGLADYRGHHLIGSYKIDDEGVRAERVSIVENGMFKAFLMSRTPRKETSRSNGHGRAGGGPAQPHISNFIVESSKGVPLAELKQRLIEMLKAQNKEYGLIIAQLDYPAIDPLGLIDTAPAGGAPGERNPLGGPLVMYRVYAKDGREEAVRGARLSGVNVRSLRDIVAAGSEPYVYDFMERGENLPFSFSPGNADLGLGGAPVSVAAPAVLLEDADVKRIRSGGQKPPLVPNPLARSD